MLGQFSLPALSILEDAAAILVRERRRIEAAMDRLFSEKVCRRSRIDGRNFEKDVEVDEISTLESLKYAPELFRGNFQCGVGR
jgi:hypothetical protein